MGDLGYQRRRAMAEGLAMGTSIFVSLVILSAAIFIILHFVIKFW